MCHAGGIGKGGKIGQKKAKTAANTTTSPECGGSVGRGVPT
jgi:hypothetical protein